jgi:cytoskeletal protein CcmA (bactofilin family)
MSLNNYTTENGDIVFPNLTLNNNLQFRNKPLGASYISIGLSSVATGAFDKGSDCISIGNVAGEFSQGDGAVAVGSQSAFIGQGNLAVAIGKQAGGFSQGENAVAVGNLAGFLNQPENSIALNATGNIVLNQDVSNAFYVNPVRNIAGSSLLQYNPSNGEISYSSDISGLSFEGALDLSGDLNVNGNSIFEGYVDIKDGLYGAVGITEFTDVSNTLLYWENAREGLQSGLNGRYEEILWVSAPYNFYLLVGRQFIQKSNDGLVWETIKELDVSANYQPFLGGITYSPELNKFIAVGCVGNSPALIPTIIENLVLSSNDGINWSNVDVSNLSGLTFLRNVIWANDISNNVGGNGMFVAVGDTGTLSTDRIIISPDGINWTNALSVPFVNNYRNVVFAPSFDASGSLLVATANGGSTGVNRISLSRDGLNWISAVDISGGSANPIFLGLAYSPSLKRFVVGNNDLTPPEIYYSDNGLNWVISTLNGTSARVSVATWNEDLGVFVVLSDRQTGNNGISISTDGINFEGGDVYGVKNFDSRGFDDVHSGITYSDLYKSFAICLRVNVGSVSNRHIKLSFGLGTKGELKLNPVVSDNLRMDVNALSTLNYQIPLIENNRMDLSGVVIDSNVDISGNLDVNGNVDISGQLLLFNTDLSGNITTSLNTHNANIKATNNTTETNKFLKVKINGADAWLPYFTTDPSDT